MEMSPLFVVPAIFESQMFMIFRLQRKNQFILFEKAEII